MRATAEEIEKMEANYRVHRKKSCGNCKHVEYKSPALFYICEKISGELHDRWMSICDFYEERD